MLPLVTLLPGEARGRTALLHGQRSSWPRADPRRGPARPPACRVLRRACHLRHEEAVCRDRSPAERHLFLQHHQVLQDCPGVAVDAEAPTRHSSEPHIENGGCHAVVVGELPGPEPHVGIPLVLHRAELAAAGGSTTAAALRRAPLRRWRNRRLEVGVHQVEQVGQHASGCADYGFLLMKSICWSSTWTGWLRNRGQSWPCLR
jgi:hypothetical protein